MKSHYFYFVSCEAHLNFGALLKSPSKEVRELAALYVVKFNYLYFRELKVSCCLYHFLNLNLFYEIIVRWKDVIMIMLLIILAIFLIFLLLLLLFHR